MNNLPISVYAVLGIFTGLIIMFIYFKYFFPLARIRARDIIPPKPKEKNKNNLLPIFINIKHNSGDYIKIADCIECTNSRVKETSILYTHKEDKILDTVRFLLIKLLLPKRLYIREEKEFNIKFEQINKK